MYILYHNLYNNYINHFRHEYLSVILFAYHLIMCDQSCGTLIMSMITTISLLNNFTLWELCLEIYVNGDFKLQATVTGLIMSSVQHKQQILARI